MSLKKLIVGAALTLSSFALADPPHRAVPAAPQFGVRTEFGRNDRFDVAAGRMLLHELDSARHDRWTLVSLDTRIAGFINSELAESRQDSRTGGRGDRREERRSARELSRISMQFSRVQGRYDRFARAEKRQLLVEAITIAERDLNDGGGMRFGRR